VGRIVDTIDANGTLKFFVQSPNQEALNHNQMKKTTNVLSHAMLQNTSNNFESLNPDNLIEGAHASTNGKPSGDTTRNLSPTKS